MATAVRGCWGCLWRRSHGHRAVQGRCQPGTRQRDGDAGRCRCGRGHRRTAAWLAAPWGTRLLSGSQGQAKGVQTRGKAAGGSQRADSWTAVGFGISSNTWRQSQLKTAAAHRFGSPVWNIRFGFGPSHCKKISSSQPDLQTLLRP